MKRLAFFVLLLGLTACRQDPRACFQWDEAQAIKGQPIQFVNCAEQAKSFEWNFGDGASTTATIPIHSFQQAGTYSVTQRAKSGDRQDEITQSVTIGKYALKTAELAAVDNVDPCALISLLIDGVPATIAEECVLGPMTINDPTNASGVWLEDISAKPLLRLVITRAGEDLVLTSGTAFDLEDFKNYPNTDFDNDSVSVRVNMEFTLVYEEP